MSPDSAEHPQLALAQFRERTGDDATHLVYAPGRVNLIGEYTDFNGGFVLPLAIELGIYMAARPRTDGQVRVWSGQFGGPPAEFDLSLPIEPGARDWSNYVRGVVAGLLEAGLAVPGFDALIYASLPAGGGLSSSAALEVATATLGEALTGTTLDPVRKALLCQKAEHVFAGMPCGIMDQFTVIFGQRGKLVLIDCQALTHELVPMHDNGASLLVINTMVRHALTDGGYAARRDDCFAAARILGVKELRDTTPAAVEAARDRMPERVFRRARHIVTENDRTLAAVAALRRGEWPALGDLMCASHASLRDDLEVSCPELDTVVNLARELGPDRGIYGCRMTGGGFGGCCVALVKSDRICEVTETLRAAYHRATGIEATIFATQPGDGPAILLQP